MKLLCATDFSNTSINAIEWAIDFLSDIGGGEIHILHCISLVRRSNMLVSLEPILREKAIEDMNTLMDKFGKRKPNVTLTNSIYKAYPREYIPIKAEKIEASFIIVGTTGLTSLKNMTVGSLTAHLADNSIMPIIAIPKKSVYRNLKNIVVGIGKKSLRSTDSIEPLTQLINKSLADPHFIQVHKEKDQKTIYDDRLPLLFKPKQFELNVVHSDEGIADTLNVVADQLNAKMICLIHQKDGWIRTIFRDTILTDELFSIELPILVLPDIKQ
jgi:nucleotide-binding universal stress UspA family protein